MTHAHDGSSSIQLRDFTVRRGDFEVGPINIDLGPGRIALIGLNGAGKSTLIASLVGELGHRGTLVIDGVEERRLPPARTGLVPQANDFPALLTVAECVSMAADLKCVERTQRSAAVENALSAVGLAGHGKVRASRLSGGERRRLACAQGIVHAPDILLFDEPTAGLDPLQRERLRDFLQCRPTGGTVIVTTHILEDVAGWADRVLVVDRGKITSDLATEHIPVGQRLSQLTDVIRGAAQ